jgi:3-hydroxybutyryl-CoA dehydrogenase
MSIQIATIGIIGSGIMGTGITQIVLQSNHHVYLYDAKAGAAQTAAEKLQETLNKLVEKNKITAESAQQALANLVIAQSLDELKNCDLVIEAIVENLSRSIGPGKYHYCFEHFVTFHYCNCIAKPTS